MFDRSTNSDGPLCAAITLTDGQELKGKLIVPPGRPLSEVLNSATSFIELEPFGGQRSLHRQVNAAIGCADQRCPGAESRPATSRGGIR